MLNTVTHPLTGPAIGFGTAPRFPVLRSEAIAWRPTTTGPVVLLREVTAIGSSHRRTPLHALDPDSRPVVRAAITTARKAPQPAVGLDGWVALA